MPDSFPNRFRIDGRVRVLSNRKFCLTCSPFGQHNTRARLEEAGDRTCVQCSRRYVYDRKKGHSRTRCNSCVVNTRRPQVKLRAIAYKGGKCSRCGYSKCVRSLGFHHLDPTQKDFGFSTMLTCSWDRLKAELNKCELVCANCHGEIHAGG